MDRDLDVLTLLLLDPCLTTGEAIREAAARRGTREVERPVPRGETWLPERLREAGAAGEVVRAA